MSSGRDACVSSGDAHAVAYRLGIVARLPGMSGQDVVAFNGRHTRRNPGRCVCIRPGMEVVDQSAGWK
jgi:hypothetical protein